MIPSRNQVTIGSEHFAATRKIIQEIDGIGIRVNAILEYIHPQLFQAHCLLRQKIMDKYPWARSLLHNDSLLMHGRSVAFNRRTPSHTDLLGPLGEWTPLIALGFSSGAKIRLAGIDEILLFDPGTIIFIRGGEIPHAIEAWNGGQRISVACFTHRNIWNEFDIAYPWSNPFPDKLHIVIKS